MQNICSILLNCLVYFAFLLFFRSSALLSKPSAVASLTFWAMCWATYSFSFLVQFGCPLLFSLSAKVAVLGLLHTPLWCFPQLLHLGFVFTAISAQPLPPPTPQPRFLIFGVIPFLPSIMANHFSTALLSTRLAHNHETHQLWILPSFPVPPSCCDSVWLVANQG